MADTYLKPQSPLEIEGKYIYPITYYDQIVMPDNSRWDGTTGDVEYAKGLSTMEPIPELALADSYGFYLAENVLCKLNIKTPAEGTFPHVELEPIFENSDNSTTFASLQMFNKKLARKENSNSYAIYDEGNKPYEIHTVQVLASDWVYNEDGFYVTPCDISGITSNNAGHVDVNLSNVSVADIPACIEAFSLINRAETYAGGVRFYCYSGVPTIDLSITVEVLK